MRLSKFTNAIESETWKDLKYYAAFSRKNSNKLLSNDEGVDVLLKIIDEWEKAAISANGQL